MFSDQETPTYTSVREVEALKARLNELETELARQSESQKANSKTVDQKPVKTQDPERQNHFSNWSSSKDSQSNGRNRIQNATRTLSLLIGAIVFSLPIYFYWAVKTGAWQIYAIIAGLIFSGVLIGLAISMVRRNRVETAMEMMIANASLIIPLIVALISAVGVVLAATQFLIILAITGQTLSGSRATRALLAGFVFSVITLIIDFTAQWPRLSVPGLQSTIPVIALTLVIALGFLLARQFQNYSLRIKLVVTFVAVALVSISAVGYVTNRVATAQLNDELGTNFNELASHMARETSDTILSNKIALDGLVLNKFIQDGVEQANRDGTQNVSFMKYLDHQWAVSTIDDRLVERVLANPVAGELRELQDRLPQYAELFVTNQYGAVIAATDQTSDYYQADEEWWQSAWNNGKGDIFVSQPEFDESAGIYAIDMALPIPAHNRSDFVGVLRATVNINELTGLLSAGQFGQTGQAVLVFPNNQFLTKEIGVNLGTLDTQAISDISSINGAYARFEYNGSPSLVSKSPVASLRLGRDGDVIQRLGWTIVIHQDLEEANQPITATTQGIVLAAIGVLIATGVLALIVGGLFSKPIENLTSVAEQIGSGNLAAKADERSKDEVGTLAQTFNRMTVQLQEMLAGLEQRVAERTHDLELATEVGRSVSEKMGDLTEMLSQSVELIRSKYELYYTQIYLMDPSGRNLVLRAGTGDAGVQLLQRGHRLMISSTSLNARAASSQRPVLVDDTLKNVNFLPNQLLPLTRSELAVPLVANNRVVGVLDMQSEKPERFSEASLPAFQVLAGQLAIAIQNAALFNQTEESRLVVEEQARRLTSSGWQEFMNAIERSESIGYVFNQNEVLPLAEFQGSQSENTLVIPIEIAGANVGEVQLADEANRKWTTSETEIVQATMANFGQHIENLRLLAQADRYRGEAEQVSRRLTNEGWREYLSTRTELGAGYLYNQNQVQPLNGNGHNGSTPALSYPLVVREEPIGELMLESVDDSQAYTTELVAAVVEQLSDHIENLRLLEQAEQKRLELETVATVSSTASTVLDPDKLLQAVVDLTKERFGLYHAHIYLADEAWQTLLMAAGAGEIGRKLVAEEHAIPMNIEQSLVARAAREGQAVIINDVGSEPGFLPNPLLPETRAEMAIPMIVGDKVLGVFDVQSNKSSGFSKEDANIYTTLASQVAVALQNARLYVEQAATVTQLRELDRLKSSFLANMSHELRTPLNSILGFTDVMLEGLDGDLTEYMDNDLRLIQKNGQHLLHLINDVLDMAKIESGRMNLHPEKFRIHSILDEVTSITSTLASEKNLALFIEEDSDQEIEIFADNTRLRQVMINLVNNSIKFTEKGKIVLRASQLDGARVLITVKDTGIGIPPEQLEDVFQEFTQVDTSTTRKVGGTGLGLPISRRLIEMHGGRLWAESTGVSGEGSTFFVELPIEARITEVIEKQEK
jgi:signal transduction histidine kinase